MIRLAIRYGIVYGVLFLSMAALTAFLLGVTHSWVIDGLLGLLAGVTGYFLGKSVKTKIDEFVLWGVFEKYRSGHILRACEEMERSGSLRQWAETLGHSIKEILDVKDVGVLVYDASEGQFKSLCLLGFEMFEWFRWVVLEWDGPLSHILNRKKSIVSKNDCIQAFEGGKQKQVRKEMERLRAEVCQPFFLKGNLVGILVVGSKKKGEPFHFLDRKVLELIGKKAEKILQIILMGKFQQEYSSEWAHDLIRPFGPKGSLQFIRKFIDDDTVDEECKKYLRSVMEEMEFVQRYIGILVHPLDFMGKEIFHIKKRILTNVYEKMKKRYSETALEKGVQWRVCVPPFDVYVLCDAVVIDQKVMSNILDVVFQRTSRGASVELNYGIEAGRFFVFVKSSNSEQSSDPLSPAEQQAALERARKAIEGHEGQMWIENEFEKESRIRFCLPLAPS